VWVFEEDLKEWACGVTEEDVRTSISMTIRMNHYVNNKDQKNPKFNDRG
jgi:hypothetical protein